MTRLTASLRNVAPKLPPCNFVPKKYQGLPYEKLKSIRKTNLNPSLSTNFSTPLAFHQGHKQWLFDINGKRYLDLFGGICTVSVGHCHPKITEAVNEQMQILGHVSNVYFHSKVHEYAEKLAQKLPEKLKVIYFVNSGSEANDLAILLARAYTNRFDIYALQGSYHGMSYQTMGLTSNFIYKYPVPQPAGFTKVMNPDVFKGIWGGKNCRDSPIQAQRKCVCHSNECQAEDKYVQQFESTFEYENKNNLAAFFVESIQGVNGAVQFPRNYLKRIYKIVRESGGIVVSDEVQSGFGRTGDHFWGFEGHKFVPDIVTMAKGIGNGYPLAAVATTPEIASALTKSAHFNTFGGNPIGSTVGMKVLEIIEEEGLQQNSNVVGGYLLKELSKLQSEFGVIGDVRGKGLMIGVELVEAEKVEVTPLGGAKFLQFWDFCKEQGLILGRGGISGNVVRILPPMCITKSDADFALEILRTAFKKIK